MTEYTEAEKIRFNKVRELYRKSYDTWYQIGKQPSVDLITTLTLYNTLGNVLKGLEWTLGTPKRPLNLREED